MKLFVLISVVCLVGGVIGSLEASRSDGSRQWKVFKSRHNKVYVDSAEEMMRKKIFLENKQLIEQHNAAQLGYEMGYSHLSDWTGDELDQLNGLQVADSQVMVGANRQAELPDHLKDILELDVKDLPTEVDWRQVPGRVSAVKDQGQCGSCWAFATTGVLEGQQHLFNMSQVVPLSEQNLVDCSKQDKGCRGGLMAFALEDIAKECGIESEQDYPYLDVKGPVEHNCTFDQSKSVMSLRAIHVLPRYEPALQKLVARFGPVASGMFGTKKLFHYKSGVFYDEDCNYWAYRPNHGILVVGYGTDPKEGDYWLIKNSWGPDWGDKGYFKLARNKQNHCDIGEQATIPIF